MPAKAKAKLNLQEAKIEVRKAIGKVVKDATQDFRKYNYVSHEAVTAAVVPAMHELGMTHTPTCKSCEVVDGVAYVHMEIAFQMAKEWMDNDDSDIEKTSVYTADKIKDGTSMGAIISYGIKTAMLKYFGLESGDEDLEDISPKAKKDTKAKGKMKTPTKEKAAEEPAPWDSSTEDSLEIFNGTTMPTAEDYKRFIDLCTLNGITNDQLEERLTKGGFEKLDRVPQDILTDWINRLEGINA